MTEETYLYTFPNGTDMRQVEDTLLLAAMAAEGLHGRSRIHLDAGFRCTPAARRVEINGATDVGEAIARIFTALLATTIGEAAFQVSRTNKEVVL